MGLYLQPSDKQAWVEKHAVAWDPKDPVSEDEIVLCLVDNGMFYALGAAYDDRELQAMMRPTERPRWYYMTKKETIKPLCPEWDKYMERGK